MPTRPREWSTAARSCGTAGMRTRRQRLLLRPRRRARPALPAAPAAPAAAREPRPVADNVQRPHAARGVRGGRRVRDAVLRPVRGPGLRAKLYLRSATYVSSRLWARYRRHEANEPPGRFSYARYYRDRRAFLEWLARHVADVPVDEDVARAASELRRARHPYRAALTVRLRPVAPPVRPSPRASTATVSVIVAFRDAAAPRAGDRGVEAQEHDRFELILFDDGSTDASTGIARAAAELTPNGSATSSIRATRTSARAARAMPASGPRAATTWFSSTPTISC